MTVTCRPAASWTHTNQSDHVRQAGMLAAACIYALDHHIDRLAEDHAAAAIFAAAVGEHSPAAVVREQVETNIVVLHTGRAPAGPVAAAAAAAGVLVSALGPFMIRAVTHLDVTAGECAEAGALVGRLIAEHSS